MNRKPIIDLSLSALGVAFLAVSGWITVPAAVPFTLQTFAVYCLFLLFPPAVGLRSLLVYEILGGVGVPVFAGFSAGFGYLLGATGGYLLGFFGIGLSAALTHRLWPQVAWAKPLSLAVGTLLCYAFGTGWFLLVYAPQSGSMGLGTALVGCVLPFLLPDGLKLLLAYWTAQKLRPLLSRLQDGS